MFKKGFTIIELLVVVVVISILTSMVIVAIGDTRKKARLTAGQSSIASIPPAMVSCLDKGGTVQQPPNVTSRLICDASHQFIADATYPDLTSKGWTYGLLTGSGDSTGFTVTCPTAMCGGTPTGYKATCNTNGCDFAAY